MTDEELSLKIAEHLEPCASLPEIVWTKPASSSFPSRANVRPGEGSPLGAWKIGPGMKWKCRDFVNDPAMTVLLLEKLGEWDEISIEECNGWNVEWYWGPVDGSEHVKVTAPSLGRAIAEVYARAEGLI